MPHPATLTMPRIFLTHTPEARANYYGDEALQGLLALGDVRLHDGMLPLDGQGLLAAAHDCDVIVCDRATPGPALVFEQHRSLVAFVRCAVDIRTIDVAAAGTAGVLVTRASPGFVDAVAELVLGMMIDLARGIGRSTRGYHAGRAPAIAIGRQLAGATLGLIGHGAIGRRVAALAGVLGMTVLVNDPFAKVDTPGARQVDLSDLLAASDFIVCLAVANAGTENLLDDAAFRQVKRGALFVNAARGNLVDEAALARALDAGILAGAAIDVGRAPDQMPSPWLAARPDVIATPHIGGLTPQAIAHQALETVRQVAAIVRGEAPPGAVNAARATRLRPLP